MSSRRRYRPLGELVENLDARRQPVKEVERRPGPYPYYGASGIVDYVDAYLFEGLHLLVAEDGENLRTRKLPIAFLADGRFWVNNHAHVVRGNGNADTRFLAYALSVADVASYLTGSTMPKLTQGNLHRIPILIPDLAEQIGVAETLGALDDKIELNHRMNETLEAMAQAVFRDWFIDFGPTHRKRAGATDPLAIMGGVTQDATKAAELAELFPAELGEDGLPLGWRLGRAEDLVEFNPQESLKKGVAAPYSDMSSLPTSGSIADLPVIREFGSGMRFRNGDALLARITPCLENGKTAFVDFLPDAATVGWGSTEFIVLRGRLGTPPPFGYLLARSDEFRAHAIQSMTGTSGRQRARAESLANWPMPLPSRAVLSSFGDFVNTFFTRISSNGTENRTLAETRDYLLPRLMSGAVRVDRSLEALQE